jgi:hypothetical protein
MSDILSTDHIFVSALYRINKQEFLSDASKVFERYMKNYTGKKNDTVKHTEFMHDPSLQNMADYILQTSWNLLEGQGYDMNNYSTYFIDFWGQRVEKDGYHFEHVHGAGSQMTGFYIIEAPKNSSRIVLHDPRPAKRQLNLPETNSSDLTFASEKINYEIFPGDLIFINSWLPHGFSTNDSNFPFKFIHFNIGVEHTHQHVYPAPANAEII